jgi:hypothetical protein
LTSIEVRVKAVDEFSPFFYPSRTLEVKTSRGSIMTPVRAATFYEYNAKMKTPTAATIQSPILVNVKKLPPEVLHSLLTKNESFGSLLRKIEMANRAGQYASLRFTLLQPTKTSNPGGDGITSMRILQRSTTAREKFLRLIIKLQQDAGMEIVTVPYIQLPFADMKKMIKDAHRDLMRLGLEPLFFVDVGHPQFEAIIRLLVDELKSNLVGLIQRRYAQYPLHYDFLRKYYNRNVAFLSVETKRYDEKFDDISTMHYLPFLGNDVYAVRVPTPFYERSERENQPMFSAWIRSDSSTDTA